MLEESAHVTSSGRTYPRAMPRRRAGERWQGMVQELVNVVVDEIMDHDHGRAMTEVTDGEIRARGIFAFHALR